MVKLANNNAPRHSLKAGRPSPPVTVIDCAGHVLGRLASVVAKQLLLGTKIVCVRAEELTKTGSFYRNKLRWMSFINKRTHTNPSRGGPWHHRAPSRMFARVVRGMIPHKTARGAAAMSRLKVFEGIPPPYDKKKRVVVPAALRILRVKPERRYTKLTRIAHEFGWKHQSLIDELEAKRKARSAEYHKLAAAQQKKRAAALKTLPTDPVLEKFGFN
eukprot:TRINITY_DN79944_c0_g1_i1.p2 TRINITY_DN79944_c0_g1~~TRINITY_DN79944_c0_g1_i1.p2  ORF type:complete len:216 (+),score=27.47 TRINITY_DN79944_c0_g1_i1:22-669(+)